MGYKQHNWKTLEQDLPTQHLSQDVSPGQQSMHGHKYEIRALLIGPNGNTKWLWAVWMDRQRETIARFIMLIPEKQP